MTAKDEFPEIIKTTVHKVQETLELTENANQTITEGKEIEAIALGVIVAVLRLTHPTMEVILEATSRKPDKDPDLLNNQSSYNLSSKITTNSGEILTY